MFRDMPEDIQDSQVASYDAPRTAMQQVASALRVLGRRGGELRPGQSRISFKAFADRGGVLNRDGRAIDEDFRQLAAIRFASNRQLISKSR